MISEKRKQIIKLIVSISVLVLLFLFIIIMMIKYEVEGETNMPFILSKIVVIGTVEGIEKQERSNTKWNFNIKQNNDVYFYIDKNVKNDKSEEELIKNVTIENIQLTTIPQKGTFKAYMPNSEQGRLFSYDEHFLISDKLEYKGAEKSSNTNLEIGSQGGTILIRFCNSNLGSYISDEAEEIVHNSSLLKNINIKNEEIKFSVSFDFILATTKARYKAPITLDFPTGNLDKEKNCYFEKTNMSDIVFKRVK